MKSLTAVCQSGASMPAINPNGRAISRHSHPQRENAEMKMYLSKLKDLVPFMPKNRKLSKLEIIQHVIDYICDLQSELETHPEMGSFDATSALNFVAASQNVMPMDASDAADADFDADEDDDEEEDREPDDALMQRLSAEATNQHNRQRHHQQHHQHQQQQHPLRQHQQQQSSLSTAPAAAVRQPLVDRQAPNTILPAASASASHAAHVGITTTITAAVSAAASATQQQQQPSPSPTSQTTSAEKHSRQNSC